MKRKGMYRIFNIALTMILVLSNFTGVKVVRAEGIGTWDSPYTVAQGILIQDNSVKTVQGYVVGQPTGTNTVLTSNFPNDYALALADTPGETDMGRMLYVQIPSAFRPQFGLFTNPGNMGIPIKVTGNLISYFSHPGLKTSTAMEKVNTAVVPVTGIALDKTEVSLQVGQALTLTAIITPANATNKKVIWASDRPDIAGVDQNTGEITPVAEGIANITASAEDGGLTASCIVTVTPAVSVTRITLNLAAAEIEAGRTVTLTAVVEPDNATNKNVIWTSSDALTASVNNGVVRGLKEGTATITATTEDGGLTASCEVIVKPATVIPIAVARTMAKGETITVKGIVTYTDGKNHYIQDDTAGMDIYRSGLSPALKAGDMIQATGVIDIYNGLFEIKPAANSDIVILSSGNILPQPKLVTIDNIGEEVEGQLIKIRNVTLGAINTTGNTPITDESGNTINIYKIPALTEILEGDKIDVTAVVSQFTNYQLLVGSAKDIVKADTRVYASDLFISEYIEGSSNNKAIEIFNGTPNSVDLSMYSVELYANGATVPGNKQLLSGTLESGQVYVIANSGAVADILSKSNITSTVTYFNGDDAFVLKHNDVIIDSFGQVGNDPGTAWGSGATLDHTLVRKSSIITGDSNSTDSFDPALEWEIKNKDDFSFLGSHTMDGFNSGSNEDTVPPAITHTPVTEGNINEDITINAAVSDNKIVASVKLFYRTKGAAEYKVLDMLSSQNSYSAVIPKAELSLQGLQYYIEASDGANITTSPADKAIPYEVSILNLDKIIPAISNLSPASGESTGDNRKPVISAEYSDQSGIDTASAKLYLDGNDVTALAAVTETGIAYTPAEDLSLGQHLVRLEVKDRAAVPNTAVMEWNFSVGRETLNLYFGQLHSHSALSDGLGTPDQAYAWARDNARADFFALTDHSNWFDNDTGSENITDISQSTSNEWKQLNATADRYNEPGKFVALGGFEMTWSGSTGGWGHINTFNTPWFVSRSNSSMDLKAYYAKLAQNPQSISQLNHPGKTFGDFSDFGFYTPEADAVVNLVEVGNGEGPIGSSGYFPSYEYYTRALDKGWHVAPTNNQDNHKGVWVNANTARTVILAPSLTRESLYSSIKQMRVYSTEDENLRINYTVNGKAMGSSLNNPESLNISIAVTDPNTTDVIGRVSIIANGGTVVASRTFDSNTAVWDLTLAPQYDYYYVRIDQGDHDIAVTAPVWVGDVIPVGISKVDVSQNPQIVGNPVDITASVYNNGSTILSNVKVEFFKNSIAAENKIGEQVIPAVTPAGSSDTKITWTPSETGTTNIYAQMIINDKVFSTSTAIEIVNSSDVIKVVVDGGHVNQYVTGDYKDKIETLKEMFRNKKVMMVLNTDELTLEDLNNARMLILTDPQSKDDSKYGLFKSNYTDTEVQVIREFVNAGGSLIITSRADYNDKGVTDPAYQSAAQGNRILEAIGSNLRFNDDEVIDKTSNGGQEYRLYFDDYTSSKYNLTNNIPQGQTYSAFSGCSVILKNAGTEENIDWLVTGHDTTESLDSDLQNDAVSVAKGQIKSLAAEVLPNGSRIIAAGTTFFSDFETAGGDNAYSNKQITDNIINWLTEEKPAEVKAIAEVRMDADNNGIPDNLGKRFAIEGRITAQSEAVTPKNAFFEVIYVQDETGGITVFGVSKTPLPLGVKVRVTGFVDQYGGDTEIQVSNEDKYVAAIDLNPVIVEPRPFTTYESMLDSNEGWLVKIKGKVTRIEGQNLYINDGSGESRVYVEGYIGDGTGNEASNGKWDASIQVGDIVSAIGLASEDPEGHRIRVRNTMEIVKLSTPVTGVTLDKSEAEIIVKGTLILTASIIPENATNKAVIWASSKPEIASVDENGKVTAINGGTAVITVKTLDGGFEASCSVTVIVPVTGIQLNKQYLTVKPGEVQQLIAVITPENATNKKIIWTSLDPEIAAVDENGNVRGIKTGVAKITAVTEDGSFKAECTVAVAEIPVTGVRINKNEITIKAGRFEMVTAHLLQGNVSVQDLVWTTDNKAVAKIGQIKQNGKTVEILGLTQGEAVITVTTLDGGFTATCRVIVIP